MPWLPCQCPTSGLQEAFPQAPLWAPRFSPCAPHVFPDDRHRVKLHPMLGDPDADYINANYIDVSASPPSSLPTWPCPLQAPHSGRANTCQGISGGSNGWGLSAPISCIREFRAGEDRVGGSHQEDSCRLLGGPEKWGGFSEVE